jgi:hypothetical protein
MTLVDYPYVEEDFDVDSLDPSEFTMDDWARALPDLSDQIPPLPPLAPQDDFEGLGGPGDSPIPPGAALKSIAHDIAVGNGWTPGYCLQYQRIKRGVGSKYYDADESLYACNHRHLITDWSKVPRGVIVHYTGGGHEHGHITSSFGEGFVGTTDWPLGKIGRVSGAALLSAWGYEKAYWTNEVNDVIVWRPSHPHHKPNPKPPTTPRLNHVIKILGDVRKDRRKDHNHHDVEVITKAIHTLVRISRD